MTTKRQRTALIGLIARHVSFLIIDGRIDAFVFNEAILKYLVGTQFPACLRVLHETFDQYYVSMTVPRDSPLRERINRFLPNVMATRDGSRIMNRYLGTSR